MNLFVVAVIIAALLLGGFIYRRWTQKPTLEERNEYLARSLHTMLQGNPVNPDPRVYVPKYTFPIPGICEDGELVDVVLKRLYEEGNGDKIAYFQKFMGLSE